MPTIRACAPAVRTSRGRPLSATCIDLTIEPDAHVLRVTDNGSGLTEAEIHGYLTVIGRGYTRELCERLAADDIESSRQLIGQFGIGFLSAYLLASAVTVETRSKGHAALRWHSVGDQEFELSVLYTYSEVAPIGYRDALEQGFAYLDQQIEMGPAKNRFVLSFRWTDYLCETQRWDEAYDRALRFLALVDSGGSGAFRFGFGAGHCSCFAGYRNPGDIA